MESVGEEKKLQALFSELKAADEQTAPSFAATWNRATIAPRRIRAFNPAFIAATALLVVALISLAVWSRYSQRSQPQPMQAAHPASPKNERTPLLAGVTPSPKVVPAPPRKTNREVVAKKISVRHDAQLLASTRKLTRDAKSIMNWQSPTTALLSSPSAEIFSSVPQLNQSATDLKAFLPTRSN